MVGRFVEVCGRGCLKVNAGKSKVGMLGWSEGLECMGNWLIGQLQKRWIDSMNCFILYLFFLSIFYLALLPLWAVYVRKLLPPSCLIPQVLLVSINIFHFPWYFVYWNWCALTQVGGMCLYIAWLDLGIWVGNTAYYLRLSMSRMESINPQFSFHFGWNRSQYG